MSRLPPSDRNGAVHGEDGRFVSIRDYFEAALEDLDRKMERIFAERESSAEFKRAALKEALDVLKVTTEQKLLDAKIAADDVIKVLRGDIDVLKSGGAPFANRLDEGLTKLRTDVDILNVESVRTKVLDALRVQQTEDAKQQKRQSRAAIFTAGIALVVALIRELANILGRVPAS